MDIRTQAALLAAIVTLALSVAALLRDNRSRVFTLFALLSADLFLFSLAIFFLRWPGTFGVGWWERLAVASGALAPAGSGALTANRPAKASDVHPGGTQYGADKAVDDDSETRWATSDGTKQAWLEVELAELSGISRMVIKEFEPRLSRFQLQYRQRADEEWKPMPTGLVTAILSRRQYEAGSSGSVSAAYSARLAQGSPSGF